FDDHLDAIGEFCGVQKPIFFRRELGPAEDRNHLHPIAWVFLGAGARHYPHHSDPCPVFRHLMVCSISPCWETANNDSAHDFRNHHPNDIAHNDGSRNGNDSRRQGPPSETNHPRWYSSKERTWRQNAPWTS